MNTIDEIMNDNKRFERHLRKPEGEEGRVVAKFLSKYNKPPTLWAISQLDIQPDDKILEVGFGTGHAIREMTQRVKSGVIHGVDFSDVMLQEAQKINSKGIDEGKVHLLLGDISDVNYNENQFDKILGINVLYFWHNPLVILRKLRDLLSPGGRLVLFIYHKDSQKDRSDDGTFLNYSGEEGVELLNQAGYQDARFIEKTFKNSSRFGVCLVGEKEK